MKTCDPHILGAYYDGELSEDDRARVEEHLRSCAACADELEAIRRASEMLRQAPLDDLTPRQLADLHDAIDDEAGGVRIWRLGGTIGLIAASILLIGMAWLNTLPAGGGVGGGGNLAGGTVPGATVARPVEPWERTAVTLRVYPPLPSDDNAIQPHDAQFADYMLDGLAMGK